MRTAYLAIGMILVLTACGSEPTKEAGSATPAAPTSSAVAAPLTSIALDFAAGTKEVTFLSGPSAADHVKEGMLQLQAFEGVMSVGMPVRVGDTYQLESEVRAVVDSTNGVDNIFFLGPIGLDAKGEIVQWWQVQAPITVAEGTRKSFSYLTIAPGTTEVRIGMHGNWADPKPAGNGTIAFMKAKLDKLPDASPNEAPPVPAEAAPT